MDDFYIACLDSNAYEQMKQYPGTFLYRDQDLVEYQDWSFDSQSKFREIVRTKWRLISDIYEQVQELCWVDTDIVFIKNPVELLKNQSKELILFQSDSPGSTLCTGFMVFNDKKYCAELIHDCAENEEEDDQVNLNLTVREKYGNHVGILNPLYFPNGYSYYKLNYKENIYLVHNNHMIGIDVKINKFKEEGLWYA